MSMHLSSEEMKTRENDIKRCKKKQLLTIKDVAGTETADSKAIAEKCI